MSASICDMQLDETPHRCGESRMTRIPAGKFPMGSDDGGGFERPVHEVWLDEFLIDTTLVTNAQFAQFVAASGYVSTAERRGKAWGLRDGKYHDIEGLCWRSYAGADRQQHPVVLVSWHDAMAYAAWLGKRLPTEAEWEKAARGRTQTMYPWGSEADVANAPFGREALHVPATAAVGSYAPNEYGLYDMVGNVWQWCADWYAADYYQRSPTRNPRGAEVGELRVRRGAAWNIIQTFRLRCANRGAVSPETTVPNLGFRCALDGS